MSVDAVFVDDHGCGDVFVECVDQNDAAP